MSGLPPYLQGKTFQEKIFSAEDKPPVKEVRESADVQMARVIRPMPDSQRMKMTGSPRDPDWIIKGEPRAVQIEALRRSYGGFWLKQSENDDNEQPYHVVDRHGLGRTGASTGWGHFLEQRLGKTPAFLNEFALFRRDHGEKWAVVIAPQSFKPEWVAETERFGLDCSAYAFDSIHRADAARWADRNSRHGGLLAVNYEALLSDSTIKFLKTLAQDRAVLAFDESINIKNDSGRLTKSAIDLSKSFRIRRDLTGKPVVQGPHDMWAQLRALGELSGFNPVAFRNRYCKVGGFQGKKVIGSKNEEELQELLAGTSFLARRCDWLQTPGTEYATRKVEMIPEQKAHYKSMEQDFLIQLAGELSAHSGAAVDEGELLTITAQQIVTKLLKLSQIASGFIIDEVGVPHDIMPRSVNPKLQELKRMVTQELSTKVIIFAHHTHAIEMLMDELKDFQPALIAGSGQMKRFQREVQAEKARFNGSRECRVIIGQEQAIRYGHTLMGGPDDPMLHEIFYENNYSLNDRSQCEERGQGSGQMGLITIWDMQCSPIEEATLEALRAKEDISSATLNYARDTGILRR